MHKIEQNPITHTQIQSILLKFADLRRKLPELSTADIDAAANPREVAHFSTD